MRAFLVCNQRTSCKGLDSRPSTNNGAKQCPPLRLPLLSPEKQGRTQEGTRFRRGRRSGPMAWSQQSSQASAEEGFTQQGKKKVVAKLPCGKAGDFDLKRNRIPNQSDWRGTGKGGGIDDGRVVPLGLHWGPAAPGIHVPRDEGKPHGIFFS